MLKSEALKLAIDGNKVQWICRDTFGHKPHHVSYIISFNGYNFYQHGAHFALIDVNTMPDNGEWEIYEEPKKEIEQSHQADGKISIRTFLEFTDRFEQKINSLTERLSKLEMTEWAKSRGFK